MRPSVLELADQRRTASRVWRLSEVPSIAGAGDQRQELVARATDRDARRLHFDRSDRCLAQAEHLIGYALAAPERRQRPAERLQPRQSLLS